MNYETQMSAREELTGRRYDEITDQQFEAAFIDGNWPVVEFALSVQNVHRTKNHLIVTGFADSDDERDLVPVDIEDGQIIRAGEGANDAMAPRWELEQYGIIECA